MLWLWGSGFMSVHACIYISDEHFWSRLYKKVQQEYQFESSEMKIRQTWLTSLHYLSIHCMLGLSIRVQLRRNIVTQWFFALNHFSHVSSQAQCQRLVCFDASAPVFDVYYWSWAYLMGVCSNKASSDCIAPGDSSQGRRVCDRPSHSK